MKIDSLEMLMTEELKDIYDAEKQITRALPKMVKAVESDALKTALKDHLEVTKGQIDRLERIFEMMGQPVKGRHCPGMKGILDEGDEVAKRQSSDSLGDEGIIGAAQKVEHYQIAAYGTARNFAEKLGRHDVADLLAQTLDEEKQADQKLTEVAEQLLSRTEIGEEEEEGNQGDENVDESAEYEEDEEIDVEEADEEEGSQRSQPAAATRSRRSSSKKS